MYVGFTDPIYVEYDTLFQNGILCSKKAVYLLQSTTTTRVVGVGVGVGVHAQDIPNWNILFGCFTQTSEQ